MIPPFVSSFREKGISFRTSIRSSIRSSTQNSIENTANEHILHAPMPRDGILNTPSSTTQSIFKCLICEKPFEQRSSRDRHLRRCRQKQLTGTIPRKKSCALCIQAKTRCDLRTPACSRCKAKGLGCQYHSLPATRGASVPASHEEASLPTPAATETEHVDDVNEANFDTSLSDAIIVDWGEIGNSLLDWAPMFGLVGAADHHGTALETRQGMPAPGSLRQLDISTLRSNGGNSITSEEQLRPASQPLRLVSLESFMHMRHRLTTQPISETERYHKFGFLNRVLRAYPKMIVAGNSLPPFVHSSSLIPGKISEALANCKGIVQMYKTMTPENRHFVMKTITQEHERILQQYISCSDSEMLSMLQAALIYCLIRHFENEPTLDRPILMQTETIAFNVGLGGLMARGEIENTRPIWEEWILAESKRRTLLALFMFDASFHHSRGLQTLTSNELRELPLPAIRNLWECTEETKWELEYERYLAGLKGERLPRVQDAWPPGDPMLFEEWYAGMDSFGVTVLSLCQNCEED